MSIFSKNIYPKLLKAIIEKVDFSSILTKCSYYQNTSLYELQIGEVLHNHINNNGKFDFTLYDIFPLQKNYFEFKIALFFDDVILIDNYSSKYKDKKKYKVRKACILYGNGCLSSDNAKIMLETFELLKWNTNLHYEKLKQLVQWESEPIKYNNQKEIFEKYIDQKTQNIFFISNLGRVKNQNEDYINFILDDKRKVFYFEDKKYIHELVASIFTHNDNKNLCTQVHHIDNNNYNNTASNLVYVSKEQHACIHTFMWDSYYLKDNILNMKYA